MSNIFVIVYRIKLFIFSIRYKKNIGTIDDLASVYAARIIIGNISLLDVPRDLRSIVLSKLKTTWWYHNYKGDTRYAINRHD